MQRNLNKLNSRKLQVFHREETDGKLLKIWKINARVKILVSEMGEFIW